MRNFSSRTMMALSLAVLAVFAASESAFAHPGHAHNSVATGFAHPIFGLDHLLAMVTVGLLASRMKGRQMWTLPTAFVALMAMGGLLGMIGGATHAFECGVSLSVIAFGLLVATSKNVSPVAAGLIVATFALCHGHAHVAEMGDSSAWGYFPAMLIATAVLHLVGLGLGVALKRGLGDWSVRLAGAGVAAAFAATLVINMGV